MLDKKKVELMTRLAFYEQTEGKEDFVKMEDILNNVSNGLIMMLAGAIVLGYISLIIVYLIVTGHIYNEKHKDARQRVKKYNHNLTRLLRMYEKENR